jgi:hypothetical protein
MWWRMAFQLDCSSILERTVCNSKKYLIQKYNRDQGFQDQKIRQDDIKS